MLLTLAWAILLSGWVYVSSPYRRQKAAIDALQQGGASISTKAADGPTWLRWLVDNDSFVRVSCISFRDTEVPPEALASLEQLMSVPQLQFTGVAVTDNTLALLSRVNLPTKPEWLELHTTAVTGSSLRVIQDWTGLKQLFLNNNPITDDGLVYVKDLTELEWLELGETQITDAGLKHLANLRSLRKLGLVNTQVTDAGMKHIAGLTNLEKLELYGTQVGDAGLKHLTGLTKLRELHLHLTQVTDEGVEQLQQALPNCHIAR
jgi:hypothetical protein